MAEEPDALNDRIMDIEIVAASASPLVGEFWIETPRGQFRFFVNEAVADMIVTELQAFLATEE